MWAESEEGQGSTFHVTSRPRRRGPGPPGGDGAAPAGRQARPRRRRQRDESRDREPPGRAWGMRIDARAALGCARRIRQGDRFDVAVIDMRCPRWTASSSPARSGAPAPTCHSCSPPRSAAYRRRAPATEFAAQLTKPVKASQLLDAVVTALADRGPKQPERPPPLAAQVDGEASRFGSWSPRTTREPAARDAAARASSATRPMSPRTASRCSKRSSASHTTSCSWTSRCPS